MKITYGIQDKHIIIQPFENVTHNRYNPADNATGTVPIVAFYRYDLQDDNTIKKTLVKIWQHFETKTSESIAISKDDVYGVTVLEAFKPGSAAYNNQQLYITKTGNGRQYNYRINLTDSYTTAFGNDSVIPDSVIETIIANTKVPGYPTTYPLGNVVTDTNFIYTQYLRSERDKRNYEIIERLQRQPLEDIIIANHRRDNIVADAILSLCQYYYDNNLFNEAVNLLAKQKNYVSLNGEKATRLSFT